MAIEKMKKKLIIAVLAAVAVCGVANVGAMVIPYKGGNKAVERKDVKPEAAAQKDAAIERTRKQVQMLDDLYKTVVVLVTEHYVNDPGTLSAASAAKALFAAMKKNGWHDVRLLGFTDVLFRADENSPKDAFERTAKEKLMAGAPLHEEVVEKQGKRYLRVVTPVPVVMEKCVMCHANFKDNEGVMGALSYTVPVIE